MDGQRVGNRDIVVGIAASGTTPYVRAALGRAQALGARTVLVGPEVITGSTRMKAGTATKLVLNMLTTGSMIRLGKTWGNLMVDLRATNAKLTDRSERILMEATALPRPAVHAALEAAGGRVKPAIVMLRRNVSLAEADRLLDTNEGRLRDVVGDPPPVRAS